MEDVEFAVVSLAGHAAETLELVAAQRVQALVAGGVLQTDGSTFGNMVIIAVTISVTISVRIIIIVIIAVTISVGIIIAVIFVVSPGQILSCRRTYSCNPSSYSGSGSGAPGSCSLRIDSPR